MNIARFRDNFWVHSVSMCAVAIAILFSARLVGQTGGDRNLGELLLHMTVIVLAAYPFQTLFAVTAMSGLCRMAPMVVCATLGCALGALPASIVSPTVNWMLGIMPTRLPVVETREQFFTDVTLRYPYILGTYITAGTLMWMLLCYRWWKRKLLLGQPVVQIAAGAVRPSSGDPAVALIDGVSDAPGEAAVPAAAPGHADAELQLVQRLPLPKRGRLLALSAEQHYVRIHTDAGNDLVLMGFSDAISPLPSDRGMRIHRSHWVSAAAVDKVKPTGAGAVVQLVNGTELPVSRSFSGAVREAFSDRVVT